MTGTPQAHVGSRHTLTRRTPEFNGGDTGSLLKPLVGPAESRTENNLSSLGFSMQRLKKKDSPSKPPSIGCGRTRGGIAAVLLLSGGLLTAGLAQAEGQGGASSTPLSMTSAHWNSSRNRLEVSGGGERGVTVNLVNAYDPSQGLGSDTIGRRGWSIQRSRPNPIPCRVRATQSDGQTVEQDVDSAPRNCAPKASQPPVANANGPYSGTAGVSLSLSSAGSNDPDGTIAAYAWNFGDGGTSTAPNPSHAYPAAGTYPVTLTVTDNDGMTANASTTASIAAAPSSQLTITRAEWNSSRNRLQVSGQGNNGATVTVVNAYDLSQTLNSGNVAGGNWSLRSVRPSPVPCRVRATQSSGGMDERNVAGAPDNCAPKAPGGGNTSPTANAGPDQTVTLATGQNSIAVTLNGSGSSDPDGTISTYNWTGTPDPANTVSPSVTLAAGSHTFTLVVTDNSGATSAADTVTITVNPTVPPQACNPANLNLSINSTSQDGCPKVGIPQQAQVVDPSYSVLAINDLGMHCGDLDTRISSILPPFQVLLAQVIQKGATPVINPAGVSVAYSAAANPNDPILNQNVFDGVWKNGNTYKTNFWAGVANGSYDPFYPGGMGITPLDIGAFPVTADRGLPVPNVEDLYIGPDGIVDSAQTGSHDGFLSAVQHAMPGLGNPYALNAPQTVKEHYLDKPFFVNFPFGYVAAEVNWFEGAGVPFAAYDDFGRENPYPLVRVQAKNAAGTVLSTVDTVLPISGEASCTNCHTTNTDYASIHGEANRTDIPTNLLNTAGLPVATSLDDPDNNMPPMVSLEYAADINVLRLHDLQHGAKYVSTACDNVPAGENCLNTAPAPCDIKANGGDGDANCLTNKALLQHQPAVCQTCHYTPALDLAHVGPLAGPEGSAANGRNQIANQSNSRVMHNNHGTITALDRNGRAMFPNIPAPTQNAAGTVTNQRHPRDGAGK